ncbi:MAG TPA: efflux RND transporter periplasmic adaptor subunit, partial [Bacteroidales bacterium]|nr:efflux RND transporter periplasmic adaptor subunit [Bacteroidales bacterium]
TYADTKDNLFSISDNNAIHADFMVYEKDFHLLKQGQKIDFTVSNRPGEELTATIFAIGKKFEPNTRAVHIHASLDRNPGDLIPGMYVSGRIHTDKNYTRTLPLDAVVSEGTKSYIFVRDMKALEEIKKTEAHEQKESDGHEETEHSSDLMAFRMVEVITGQTDDGYIQVNLLGSLPEKTQVVMNAAYYLLADMKKEETEHEH